MAYHRNDTVLRLLAHTYGQRGTVALPIQRTASTQTGLFPAGVTDVLTHLVDVYADWQPDRALHWCFLVGGPGNGKSEALRLLADTLRVPLPPRASGDPAPRTVPTDWPARGLPVVPGLEIAFINDASIPREESLVAQGPTSLFRDISDALGRLEETATPVVLFANVNRGILVEELAAIDAGRNPVTTDVGQVTGAILRWLAKPEEQPSGTPVPLTITVSSTAATRYYAQLSLPPHGPRTSSLVIHAVFLDSLSLLEPTPGNQRSVNFALDPPVAAPYKPLGGLDAAQGTRAATVAGDRARHWAHASKWDTGACLAQDGTLCAAHAQCPFAQNAAWLRDPTLLDHYLSALRAVEIVSGRRLTYRDLLANISAALLGGPEQRWLEGVHPCAWVEERHHSSGPSDLVALLHHRIYANLFPKPVAGARKWGATGLGVTGSAYRSVRQWLSDTSDEQATPFQASFAKLDPALDSDPWQRLRSRVTDISESADVELPAVQLARLVDIAAAAHSSLESVLDQVLASEISSELGQGDRGAANRVRVLRKWRATFLLRQAGLATGNVAFRATVAAWLREQSIALNDLPGSPLRVGLENLILPRLSITGGQVHILILPFRPRTYALNAVPPPNTVFAAIPHGDLRISMDADGDRLIAHLLMVGSRGVQSIADVVVDFSIAREALLRAGGDNDGFTEIGYAAFARIERARAALVGRKRAEGLPFHAVTGDGRLVRIEPNPLGTPPLRSVAV